MVFLTGDHASFQLRYGIESGFKNSGISIGKSGKIIVAIRSTLSLEIPLSNDGTLLVSKEYISFVVNICNEKMLDNWQRIDRFYTCLQKINNSTVIKKKPKKIHKQDSEKSYQPNGEKKNEETGNSVNFYDALSDFQSLINDSVD